ncbi:Transcriptional regulatory protein YycF [Stieleria neptunia]|uniref:Transcriptional regulatory protein YycF n=1 Tax=Stieleria neptunia TaxID=2527979 RepID=A0A518HTK0_9BACT|nr:response regulator [Stieleria neptunia]QDV44144.1 Transcriptional regulatory protein YycF [Stieleria neptunia]
MSHDSKIVVIDDDRGIVLGVQMRLTHAGYEVLVAYDGTEGLELIQSANPDLVLLDVQMPNLDGLAVLKALQDDPATATPPVIMLSASLQDQQTALDAGAHYFLTKPYRSSDLLDAVTSVFSVPACTG